MAGGGAGAVGVAGGTFEVVGFGFGFAVGTGTGTAREISWVDGELADGVTRTVAAGVGTRWARFVTATFLTCLAGCLTGNGLDGPVAVGRGVRVGLAWGALTATGVALPAGLAQR